MKLIKYLASLFRKSSRVENCTIQGKLILYGPRAVARNVEIITAQR